MDRAIVKRHAMTGSGLGPLRGSRPAPGFYEGTEWGPGLPVPVELSPSPSLTQHPPTENTPLHSAGLS
ncbi:MAG: hypothetical protein WC626_00870 [Methanoregula sp.]